MTKGETFIITQGYYSDYGIYGTFTALEDFSFDLEVAGWRGCNPKGFELQKFLESLESRGVIKTANLIELRCGDWGDAPDPFLERETREERRSNAR